LSGTSHTYHNDTPKNSSQDGHWLRSINSSNGSTYWYTSNNGFGSGYAANACLGVVPAFCF
jgi:hypothetical protein